MGFALVDLFDYWVHHPSSIMQDDPDRTYWFAVKRAEWIGTQFLGQTVAASADMDSLDDFHEQGVDVEDGATRPEESYEDDEERQYVLSLVADLDGDKADWLQSFLGGVTTRDEARERGVSQPAIVQRRQALLRELRATARQDGMVA